VPLIETELLSKMLLVSFLRHRSDQSFQNFFDGISDDELDAIIAFAQNALGIVDESTSGASETPH
jgi:hypothetical protein